MKRSVARQEEIASKYTSGPLVNFTQAEQKKDLVLNQRSLNSMQQHDADMSTRWQKESIKRQSEKQRLSDDLIDQMN